MADMTRAAERFLSTTLGLPAGAERLLRDLVHQRLGIFFDDERCGALVDKLAPLVVERGFGSFLDYYYLLRYDLDAHAEWDRVIDALSVTETYLWREMDQVRALTDTLLPALARSQPGEPVRIWSAACASGEEPLTLAIALEEAGWFARLPIEIRASDASPAAIARARRGRYRERSFRSFPLVLREKYFRPRDGEWEVVPELAARIDYAVANVLEAPAAGDGAHIVFCRNVFIYFSEQAVHRCVRLLARHMPVPGYLFLGAAESLLKVTCDFDLEEIGGAFVYVKRGAGTASDIRARGLRP